MNMAKLLNNTGLTSGCIFNKKYELKYTTTRDISRTNSWYIIPKDALLEGL